MKRRTLFEQAFKVSYIINNYTNGIVNWKRKGSRVDQSPKYTEQDKKMILEGIQRLAKKMTTEDI